MATTRFRKRYLAAAAAMAALVGLAPAQNFFGGGGGGNSGGGGGSFGRSMMQRSQSGMSRSQSGNSSRSFNSQRFNSQMSQKFQQGSPSGQSSKSSGGSLDVSKMRSRFQGNSSSNSGSKLGSSQGTTRNKSFGDQVKSRLQDATQGSQLGSGKSPNLGRTRGSLDGKSNGKLNLDQRFKDLSGQFNRGSKGQGSRGGLDAVLDRVGKGSGGASGSSLTDALRGNFTREGNENSFQQRLQRGGLDKMFGGELTKRVNWTEQLKFAGQGDVARRLNLKSQLVNGGGWSNSKFKGLVNANYNQHCAPVAYCGPGWYPNHCYYPTWSPWVSWCWNYSCDPYWDPRPWYCRPIYYRPCVQWVYCDYPVWEPLPVGCGTWVDVSPATSAAVDLQLQAVRFVDPGHPERNEGPRFRVWVHNASTAPITEPFNVMLLAANDDKLTKDLPQAGVTVSAMKPDEVQAIDVRLPVEVNSMGTNDEGQAAPFTTLHVVVDSHRQIDETSEANNGQALARTDVDPIDPYVLSSDAKDNQVVDGATVILAGEGLGPEPGQVVVHLQSPGADADDKVEVEAEITGWCDQGVQVLLPPLPLAIDTEANLIVIRGDGAMANPLAMKIVPQQAELTTDAPRVASR